MSKYIAFKDAFPSIDITQFEKITTHAINKMINGQMLELVNKPEVCVYAPYTNDLSFIGFSPLQIYIKYIQKYSINATVSEAYKKKTWPGGFFTGGFIFDMSNCGMGSIHNINNMNYKGLGVYTLNLIERIMKSVKRNKIICSINTRQKEKGADKWLEKCGYSVTDTFIGGNSGQQCYTYSKDLSKQNIIEVRPVKDVKP